MSSKLILASASPRRRELLNQLRLDFEVEVSHGEEVVDQTLDLGERVKTLALQKALSVARNHQKALVLGADTIVVLDKHILGKPRDDEDARRMLTNLSGRWHSVYTGVALVKAEDLTYCTDYEKSLVKFKPLTLSEINAYIATREPMDKAGSYGIQEIGSIFVEEIRGCYFNIVGLPLYKLNKILKGYGINVLR